MNKKKRDTQTRTMDIILVIVGILLIGFTVAMIILFRKYGSTPDTLITCVFATLAGECGIMGWIKTTKEKHKEREWYLEDEKRHNKQNKTNN